MLEADPALAELDVETVTNCLIGVVAVPYGSPAVSSNLALPLLSNSMGRFLKHMLQTYLVVRAVIEMLDLAIKAVDGLFGADRLLLVSSPTAW